MRRAGLPRRRPSAGVRARRSAAVAPGWPGPGYRQSRAGARQEGGDFADGVLAAGGFGQREVRLDLVAVAAAVFLLHHVAGRAHPARREDPGHRSRIHPGRRSHPHPRPLPGPGNNPRRLRRPSRVRRLVVHTSMAARTRCPRHRARLAVAGQQVRGPIQVCRTARVPRCPMPSHLAASTRTMPDSKIGSFDAVSIMPAHPGARSLACR
jgi:hypothetical protein